MKKQGMEKLHILVVDDEEDIRRRLRYYLESQGFYVETAQDGEEAWKIVQERPIDLVITDLKMPKRDGMELLRLIREEFPDVEVIIVTGHGDMESAVQALRYGALDFFNKPLHLKQLEGALLRSQKFLTTRRENRLLRARNRAQEDVKSVEDIKGKSEAIQKLREWIVKACEYDTTVLITGESGTGKELVARAIHFGSARKKYPFVTVNCSAIPENLVESEFFGHRKGAFTGAYEHKLGFFQTADKGSIFLDEIGDMPLSGQMKLLRVLEEKKIKPIGYRYDIEIDVRIIAATNQDLESLIRQGRFRSDLYFRLNVFPIHVPPLRERKEDIPILVEHFVKDLSLYLRKQIQSIDPKVFKKLMEYSFPGNVRELRNMVERAMILCNGSTLKWEHFQVFMGRNQLISEENHFLESLNLKEHEKYLIKKALEKTNYNRHQAAKLLGISWSTLNRKMQAMGIEKQRSQ